MMFCCSMSLRALKRQNSSYSLQTESPRHFLGTTRLARALSTGRVDGALSRRFAVLSDARRNHIRGLLDDLPDRMELVHQRFLVPPMSALASVMLVNLLNAEAVATALILDASIVVTTDSALLGRAAGVASIDVTIIREP
jgi:hypothetical protein